MPDNKDDQPQWLGAQTQLPDGVSSEIDDYFLHTPVREWSVRDFLKGHSDCAAFIAGIDKIRRRCSVDMTIRKYATSWAKFLGGDLGKLRLEAFMAETKTSLTDGIIFDEGRHLAQHFYRGHLRHATVC